MFDKRRALGQAERAWEGILPTIERYITIPNVSCGFDPQWEQNGHIEHAVRIIFGWCSSQRVPGLTVEVVRLEGRTPLIYMEVPGTDEGGETVLLYGHCDKQPGMEELWAEGLSPWRPVLRGDRLYGRGGADDGYAAFAAVSAIRILAEQGIPYSRCVILIECAEESGSPDLEAYVEHLAGRIGIPSLIVCLDSGCGNYDQLWMTTSLRGVVGGVLRVGVLNEGVHSGDASGIVPETFRIARMLIDRIEDPQTGFVRIESLHVHTPPERVAQARAVAAMLGADVYKKFPFLPGVVPMFSDLTTLVLGRTWEPYLAVTGAEGFPLPAGAGNVLRPYTALKLSMRIPPTADAAACAGTMKEALEAEPPYGASATFTLDHPAAGWNAPVLAPWLEGAVEEASQAYFGGSAMAWGEGGTIPFMKMLGDKFPDAQFVVTGLLGPESNAHGPNEFLHLPSAVKLTASVARIVAAHAAR